MAKFLLLLAVIAAVVLLVRNYQRALGRPDDTHKSESGADAEASRAATLSEDMVRCAHCGVHLPKSESYLSQGRFFCSDEHRRLGTPGNGNGA